MFTPLITTSSFKISFKVNPADLFISNRIDNLPNDPVARFHIGNGAILERINFLSDTSEKGLEQSLGFMVNYLYNLEEVEINHEKYVVDKKINTSKSLEKEFIKLNIEIG